MRLALNREWAARCWSRKPDQRDGADSSSASTARRGAFGAALAGTIVTFVVTVWGSRAAFVLPVMIALLAIYVRLLSPESPYWVRTQDRKRRIAAIG